MLPKYFYDINSRLPDGRFRWFDEFADEAPSVIQPNKDLDINYLRERSNRNRAYSKWQASFCHRNMDGDIVPLFKPKTLLFQVIQILHDTHSETNKLDWWPEYRDALFRVFVSPETVYDPASGEHKQWYLLSPEDCYLVNRYEAEKVMPSLPPRCSGLRLRTPTYLAPCFRRLRRISMS